MIKIIQLFQILILILFLKLNTTFGKSIIADKIIAIVNQDIILNSDITNKINFMQYDNIFKDDAYIFKKNQLYYTILDQLITNSLIFQMAIKNNINIDFDQTKNHIIEHAARIRNMTINQFYIYLNNIGLDRNRYFSEIYQEMLKKTIYNGIAYHNCHISSNEVIKIAKKLNFIDLQKKFKLTHIIIKLPMQESLSKINQGKEFATFLIKEKKNHQNLQKFIENHYYRSNNLFPQFTIQNTGWVSWLDIPIIFDQSLKTAKPGDNIGPIYSHDGIHILEINDIYTDQHISPIIRVKINNIISKDKSNNTNIKQKLLKIKKEIENGNSTFSIILQEKAQDFYSDNYGDLVQWINLNQFDLLTQNTLLSLKKNQISMPIYTNNRWHLIKLIDINKLTYSEIIYERAYSHVLHQKFDETIYNWIQELKSQSYIKIIN